MSMDGVDSETRFSPVPRPASDPLFRLIRRLALELADVLGGTPARRRHAEGAMRRIAAAAAAPAGTETGRALPGAAPALPPRLKRVLEGLLDGDSEKQIARALRLSRHTVHGYVKQLYRRIEVSSRAELLALYAGRGRGDPKNRAAPE